jgi:hypothetical protein
MNGSLMSTNVGTGNRIKNVIGISEEKRILGSISVICFLETYSAHEVK